MLRTRAEGVFWPGLQRGRRERGPPPYSRQSLSPAEREALFLARVHAAPAPALEIVRAPWEEICRRSGSSVGHRGFAEAGFATCANDPHDLSPDFEVSLELD